MYDKQAFREQARANRIKRIQQWDEEESKQAGATASPSPHDTFGIEAQARAEWQRSPAIRAEFVELERYIAFRRAEAKGLVRILGRDRGA